MIDPKNGWSRFESTAEKLEYMKKHGLISKTATLPKSVVYSGAYVKSPTRCELIGYDGPYGAVLNINGTLHCIHPDYLQEMQTGRSHINTPDEYVVIDLETTGVDHKRDSIIEIAAAKYKNNAEIDTFETLINPEFEISVFIQQLTGIQQAELDAAPTLQAVLPDLFDFLGDLPLVAHNAPFEKKFLTSVYRAAGVEFKHKMIDTLQLARKAFPDLESYSLEQLKTELNLSKPESHRALPDVYNTAELYLLCLDPRLRDVEKETNPKTENSTAAYPTESGFDSSEDEPGGSGKEPLVITEDEQRAFELISGALEPSLFRDGLDVSLFGIKAIRNKSSVFFGKESNLFCRVRFREQKNYLELPLPYAKPAAQYGAVEIPQSKDGTPITKGYCKLLCSSPEDLENMTPLFLLVLDNVIDGLLTDYGCCSRYVECSDARKCLNPNKKSALGCYYLKNLRKGNIFYGKNKIDKPIVF